jgi:adenylate cyclase
MLAIAEQRDNQAAILFADIYGYSRLMGKDEENTATRVVRAIGLIKSLIGDYGGEIKNITGDGVLALFSSGSQAVNFAVEMQREFRNDLVWNSQFDPISFRIGINLGKVREDATGIQGHSVNIASRIQEVAEPGGICISKNVHGIAHTIEGIKWRSIGYPSLKNIEEEVEVFAVEVNGGSKIAAKPLPFKLHEKIASITENSIAVLQLENLSGEPQYTHVCSGITGDIITNLTRFRDLHVIAQRSSSAFLGRNFSSREIGERLGVRYLVTGGLQRAGGKIRIQVQLMDAQTERSIWSEHFNGNLDEIFEFQDEVTAVIAARLSAEMDAAEYQRQKLTAPNDLQAYGLILRGKDVFHRLQRESNLHARRLFEQASDVDPQYSRAYVGISRALNDAWRFDWADNTQASLDEAMQQAELAIKFDPRDARGHAALGSACLYKRQHDESLASYERAIQFNPNDADVLAEMGHSVSVYGDTERAVKLIKRAMSLNPYYPDWYLWHLGEAYFDMNDYEEVIHTLNKMHDKTEAYRMLVASNAHLDRLDEASACVEQLLITHPEFTLSHWENVPPDRNPGPRERLIEGLKKAGLK